MPVAPTLVGRTYPPTEVYTVGREKIREFADALDDPNPAYRDVEAARALGHADLVAPPTFPVVLAAEATERLFRDPEAGIDFSRVVHGEQRFVHERPVVAGDRLLVELTVEAVRVVAGNELVTSRTDARTEDGELVVSATMLIVVRGAEA
jgi:acyl dehydratase